MTIDWSLAKTGAIAVHRNGGRSVITSIETIKTKSGHSYRVKYYGNDIEYWYDDKGSIMNEAYTPTDIFAIESAPEPVEIEYYFSFIDRDRLHRRPGSDNTHRITFNLTNGKPDCGSIKMETL